LRTFAEGVPQEYRDLLFDPQTSGGLLIAILPESAEAAISAFDRHGVSARRIGKVIAKTIRFCSSVRMSRPGRIG